MYVTNTMIETKMLVKMSVSFQINQSNPRSFREISFQRWTIPLANIFPGCFNLFTRAFIRWNSREFRVCEVREEKWKIVAGKICGKFGGNLRSFRQSKNGAAFEEVCEHGFSKPCHGNLHILSLRMNAIRALRGQIRR